MLINASLRRINKKQNTIILKDKATKVQNSLTKNKCVTVVSTGSNYSDNVQNNPWDIK